MPLTRERCKCCQRFSAVGFSVPDKVWQSIVPEEYLSKVLCIQCFDMFATEVHIDWTKKVELYPTSAEGFYQSQLNELYEELGWARND